MWRPVQVAFLATVAVEPVAAVGERIGAGGPVELFKSGVSTLPWSKGKPVCYRIPSLLRSSGTGALLAFVGERLGSKVGDCNDESPSNLVLRRSFDNGTTWEPAQLVVPSGAEKAERSPWTIQDAESPTNRVFLFYNTDVSGACTCGVSYVTSDDEGASWSANATAIPDAAGVIGSGLTSGITTTKSGTLVGCMRKICRNSCPADYHSFSFFSTDRGQTWNASDFMAAGSTECEIAELGDGRLYASIRPYKGWTGKKDVRLRAFSHDDGKTWTDVEAEPSLPDVGFGDEGSVVGDPHNSVLYFVHPDASGRENMTVWRSVDNAATWPSADTRNVYSGSAAYSDSAILDPGASGGDARNVGVLFEADSYGRILFQAVAF